MKVGNFDSLDAMLTNSQFAFMLVVPGRRLKNSDADEANKTSFGCSNASGYPVFPSYVSFLCLPRLSVSPFLDESIN